MSSIYGEILAKQRLNYILTILFDDDIILSRKTLSTELCLVLRASQERNKK